MLSFKLIGAVYAFQYRGSRATNKKVRKSVKNLIEKEEATGKSEGSLDKLELRSVWNL